MKKIIFLLLFCPVLLFAQSEVSFMGIPVSCSYEQFNAQLSKKLSQIEVGSDYISYAGTFAGIEKCDISAEKDKDGNIAQIIVMKNLWEDSADLRELKIKYDDKYGAPVDKKNDDGLIIYTYRRGEVAIELWMGYGDVRHPSKPTEFMIIYYPRKFKSLSTDDI